MHQLSLLLFGVAPAVEMCATTPNACQGLRPPLTPRTCAQSLSQRLGVPLQEADRFATARTEYRMRNGSVSIPNMECSLFVTGMDDPKSEVTVTPRPLAMHHSASRLAVMEAMVLAGEVAAKFGAEQGLPLLYRCALASHIYARWALRVTKPRGTRLHARRKQSWGWT